ncbi:MAG: hypothetical protein AAB405_01810 [Patescibacteria group bacterium]
MIIADLKKSSLLNYSDEGGEADIDTSCEDCGAELDNQQLCPNCDSEIDAAEELGTEDDPDKKDEE